MKESNKQKNIFRMTTGRELPREIDLTSFIEVLYQEVAIKNEMNYTFLDMRKEIENLIGQMNEKEKQQLLSESMFLNIISYENQIMENLLKKLKI